MAVRWAGVALFLVLALTGCKSGNDPGAGVLVGHVVPLPDGRSVVCVDRGTNSGGPSCDWEHAR